MEQFCQSCSMPLSLDVLGTEADGNASGKYCKYCFQGWEFTSFPSMEEMAETCARHMTAAHPEWTLGQAREHMKALLPRLTRWKK